ncbi:hypothetical protein FRACA_1370001 [Frankia canadensis]|uniref:Uncharacterized protein n=1 Tax=Frankia canadensis TaxID=1836972 RepID=A0A2I2KKY6_9ACTN|nr:hypothetical protein FRACA_1370001 [Frankia canadensis]SOU53632.1 hypothetical protein FRACA_1370001 [Frankia canadensis]
MTSSPAADDPPDSINEEDHPGDGDRQAWIDEQLRSAPPVPENYARLIAAILWNTADREG